MKENKKINKKVIIPVLIGIFAVIVVALIAVIGADKVPSEERIREDFESMSGDLLYISNPFTGVEDVVCMDIISFTLDKSLTTETGYQAYCIVEMENCNYNCEKYLIFDYVKYDGNEYELFDCYEYESASYTVLAFPYEEEEVINMFKESEERDDIEVTTIFDGQTFICECKYKDEFKNATDNITITEEYRFNGTGWTKINRDNNCDTQWHLVGEWGFVEDSRHSIKLKIVEFNFEPLTVKGTCEFVYAGMGVYGPWDYGDAFAENDTYKIEDAKKIEGKYNGITITFNAYDVIYIQKDSAHARYSGNWSEEIERKSEA